MHLRHGRTAESSSAAAQRALNTLEIVFQPIIELATGSLAVVEALARFGSDPALGTESVIEWAHAHGHGYAFEAACVRKALDRRQELPSGVRLAINLSPDVVSHDALANLLDDDLDGVIIEITENAVTDPVALEEQIVRLRRKGALIAVDDVGTGYAGLLRLATMRPDFVKIDRTIVTGLRENSPQRAVLDSLVRLSQRVGAMTIGEGVESVEDLVALADLDVDLGQGWAISRPAPEVRPVDPAIVLTCQHARDSALRRHEASGASAASVRGMHDVTLALASATGPGELRHAIGRAAAEIRVDTLAVSALGIDGMLREVAIAGGELDTTEYALADFPATDSVLRTGNPVEAHLSDPHTDPAEKRVMRRLGFASLLIVPLYIDARPVGILEFAHLTHRRWTSSDIAHARGLATHLSLALSRIAPDWFALMRPQAQPIRPPAAPVLPQDGPVRSPVEPVTAAF